MSLPHEAQHTERLLDVMGNESQVARVVQRCGAWTDVVLVRVSWSTACQTPLRVADPQPPLIWPLDHVLHSDGCSLRQLAQEGEWVVWRDQHQRAAGGDGVERAQHASMPDGVGDQAYVQDHVLFFVVAAAAAASGRRCKRDYLSHALFLLFSSMWEQWRRNLPVPPGKGFVGHGTTWMEPWAPRPASAMMWDTNG